MKLIPLLLLFACDELKPEYKDYYQNGKLIAQCRHSFRLNCGIVLNDCTSGREYYCMQNIEIRKTDEKVK